MVKPKINIQISAPNMKRAEFGIVGTAPLVIHRFSAKTKLQMVQKMETGTQAKTAKKDRKAENQDDKYNESRYISAAGWDGFNVSSIRCGLISVCRLVDFKMTLAKLCLFVEADGRDKFEPEIGLIRIYGKPRRLDSMARVETGQAYVTVRACYDEWKSKIRVVFDGDKFTVTDVANLLSRMGIQNGLGEGRPNSKNSAGMDWGTFRLEGKQNETE